MSNPLKRIALSATLILGLVIVWFTITMIYIGVHTTFASAEVVWVTNNMIVDDNHWDIHYDGNTCFQWQIQLGEPIPTVVNNPIATVRIFPIDDFDLIQIQECRGSWGDGE